MAQARRWFGLPVSRQQTAALHNTPCRLQRCCPSLAQARPSQACRAHLVVLHAAAPLLRRTGRRRRRSDASRCRLPPTTAAGSASAPTSRRAGGTGTRESTCTRQGCHMRGCRLHGWLCGGMAAAGALFNSFELEEQGRPRLRTCPCLCASTRPLPLVLPRRRSTRQRWRRRGCPPAPSMASTPGLRCASRPATSPHTLPPPACLGRALQAARPAGVLQAAPTRCCLASCRPACHRPWGATPRPPAGRGVPAPAARLHRRLPAAGGRHPARHRPGPAASGELL